MWTNFFVVVAGASAALAGLVIVALSVNLDRILEHPHQPARAGAGNSRLMLILVNNMASVLSQRLRTWGIETIGACC